MPFGRRLAVLSLVSACALPPDPGVPVPVPGNVPAPVLAEPPTAVALPEPVPDADLARRVAADSAADAAVLDLLAQAEAPSGDSIDVIQYDLDVSTWAEHDRVRYYLNFFQGPARERMAIWLERLPRYESHIRARLVEQGLPGDLVYLALIESGYSNTAVSRSRAVGMWQFMQPTGRMFGLRVDSWVDERRDFIKATAAAARYLADLTRRFGSHFLAAAAYNGGPGRVSRGLDRITVAVSDDLEENGGQAGDAAFFQLSDTRLIHQETKDYVPKLLAATMIAKEPAKYGFAPAPEVAPFPFDSLVVTSATGLDVIARLAGVPLTEIRALNPQYLRSTTPPGRSSVVRLPAGTMGAVTAAYAELPASQRVQFREHVVARGETLSGIARRYGISTQVLADANPGLGGRAVLRIGQRLQVPGAGGTATRSVTQASRGGTATPAAAPAAARVHVVARGETLSAIAARYRVPVSRIQELNRITSANRLQVGQRLRIPNA